MADLPLLRDEITSRACAESAGAKSASTSFYKEVFMTNEKTSIQVSMATKNRLDKIGLKKDTYNDILIRLLDQAKRKRRQG